MTTAALEKLCKGFKGTTVDIKWGNDLCYLIGKKMYCVTAMDGPFRISFKATVEDFYLLTEREGIIPAPYLARYHWILVEKPAALSMPEWKHYVGTSFQLAKEKLPVKAKRLL
ncbi:MAG: MmcQ/YjbR family DNA-binding protein [Cytophagales bacterium]|nr:MmcQ/YjbR family DNA-binding protein [Cytophagales bacterium]